MNFISCIKWVKQGTGKSIPDKVHLNEEELKHILEEQEAEVIDENKNDTTIDDEYKFGQYDEEDDTLKVKIKDVVVYDKKYAKQKRTESDSDSEEDEQIKPNDNMLVVGHIDNDYNALEVYVYNHDDDDFYIHHDIFLSSVPLCVEWVDFSRYSTESKNMCVVGNMNSVVEIWDLDIIGNVEPSLKLGRKKNKSPQKNYGHLDAVLDVAWNVELPHILATGSVDETVILWDLDSLSVSTTMSTFSDKVQSLEWNPSSNYNLLVGSADKRVRNFDCRAYDECQKWKIKSPVEKVAWSIDNPSYFFVGSEKGYAYIFDTRMTKPVTIFGAHEKEITGLVVSQSFPDHLISCSTDETLKIWDVSSEPRLKYSKNLKLDNLHCLDINPNFPHIISVGGTSLRKNKNVKLIDLNKEFGVHNNTDSNVQSFLDSTHDKPENFNVALLENKPVSLKKTKQPNNENRIKHCKNIKKEVPENSNKSDGKPVKRKKLKKQNHEEEEICFKYVKNEVVLPENPNVNEGNSAINVLKKKRNKKNRNRTIKN